MAKINKYWGLVAVGALTAAAAGAMAAVLMKNKAVPEFEDDFDEDFDNLEKTEEPEKESGEAFVSWEEAPVEEACEAEETEEAPEAEEAEEAAKPEEAPEVPEVPEAAETEENSEAE